MRTHWQEESDPGGEPLGQDASLAVHIISVSAAMVGVCLTVIGLFQVVQGLHALDTPADNILAVDAVVFLLAVLIATTGVDLNQAPAAGTQASTARDQRPALIKVIDGFSDWLREWRAWARKETDRRPQSSTATVPDPTGQAMTPSPASPSSTRRLL